MENMFLTINFLITIMILVIGTAIFTIIFTNKNEENKENKMIKRELSEMKETMDFMVDNIKRYDKSIEVLNACMEQNRKDLDMLVEVFGKLNTMMETMNNKEVKK